MKTDQRVLLVNDLAGFILEVPPDLRDKGIYTPTVVHLNLTEKLTFVGKYHIPHKDMSINLQGVNPEGEIVWLMNQWPISVRPGEKGEPAWVPWNPREQSIYDGTIQVRRLVCEHLDCHGYDVRDGQYAISKNVQPVRGVFECVKWIQGDDDTYTVIALDDPASPLPTLPPSRGEPEGGGPGVREE